MSKEKAQQAIRDARLAFLKQDATTGQKRMYLQALQGMGAAEKAEARGVRVIPAVWESIVQSARVAAASPRARRNVERAALR